MAMSRKDFEATASIVHGIGDLGTRLHVAQQFADWFATENPRFDRARFLTACGID